MCELPYAMQEKTKIYSAFVAWAMPILCNGVVKKRNLFCIRQIFIAILLGFIGLKAKTSSAFVGWAMPISKNTDGHSPSYEGQFFVHNSPDCIDLKAKIFSTFVGWAMPITANTDGYSPSYMITCEVNA